MPAQPPGLSTLLGMGAVIEVVVAAGLGLGWLVDNLAGTTPIGTLVGILLGVVGAISYTVVSFRKYLGK